MKNNNFKCRIKSGILQALHSKNYFELIQMKIKMGNILLIILNQQSGEERMLAGAIQGLILGVVLIIIFAVRSKKKSSLYGSNYAKLSNEKKSTVNHSISINFFKKKNYQEALKYVNRSIELYPKNHFAYDSRAEIKYYLHDFTGALIDVERSLQLDASEAIKFYHRGFIHKSLGNFDKAISDWKIAFEMGYQDAEVPLKNNAPEVLL